MYVLPYNFGNIYTHRLGRISQIELCLFLNTQPNTIISSKSRIHVRYNVCVICKLLANIKNAYAQLMLLSQPDRLPL